MSAPDYYATLGVAPSSDDVVIRAAFKAMMLKYHPDTNKSADATMRAAAINEAFAVLGNSKARAEYDAARKARKQKADRSGNSGSTAHSPPPPQPPPPRASTVVQPMPDNGSTWLPTALTVGLILVCVAGFSTANDRPSAATRASTFEEPMDGTLDAATMLAGSATTDANAAPDTLANLLDPLENEPQRLGLPQPPVDFAVIEQATKDFDRVLQKSGISGARTYSQACHAKVRAAPTWDTADHCAAFDFAAAYIDGGMSKLGIASMPYFEFQRDNQGDNYVAAGAPSYVIFSRLNKVRTAASNTVTEVIQSRLALAEAEQENLEEKPTSIASPVERWKSNYDNSVGNVVAAE